MMFHSGLLLWTSFLYIKREPPGDIESLKSSHTQEAPLCSIRAGPAPTYGGKRDWVRGSSRNTSLAQKCDISVI